VKTTTPETSLQLNDPSRKIHQILSLRNFASDDSREESDFQKHHFSAIEEQSERETTNFMSKKGGIGDSATT